MDTAETTDGGPMTHIYLINLSPAILIDMLHGQGWTPEPAGEQKHHPPNEEDATR